MVFQFVVWLVVVVVVVRTRAATKFEALLFLTVAYSLRFRADEVSRDHLENFGWARFLPWNNNNKRPGY
jgi:hypothetical protein